MITRQKIFDLGLPVDGRYSNEFFLFGDKAITHWKENEWKIVDMKSGNPYRVIQIISDWDDFVKELKQQKLT